MAGKLIVLEGMDGSGTTTQSQFLTKELMARGFKVLESAEPTRSAIGQEIRRLLSLPIEKEQNLLIALALCFAADRMQHIHETIAPGLLTHDFVILDRYILSSLVYQGLHLPTSFVKEINAYALKPDLTLILDLDPKLAHERLSSRVRAKDFYETPDLLKKLRSRYLQLAKNEPRHMVIDATGTVEQVQSHLFNIVKEELLRNN